MATKSWFKGWPKSNSSSEPGSSEGENKMPDGDSHLPTNYGQEAVPRSDVIRLSFDDMVQMSNDELRELLDQQKTPPGKHGAALEAAAKAAVNSADALSKVAEGSNGQTSQADKEAADRAAADAHLAAASATVSVQKLRTAFEPSTTAPPKRAGWGSESINAWLPKEEGIDRGMKASPQSPSAPPYPSVPPYPNVGKPWEENSGTDDVIVGIGPDEPGVLAGERDSVSTNNGVPATSQIPAGADLSKEYSIDVLGLDLDKPKQATNYESLPVQKLVPAPPAAGLSTPPPPPAPIEDYGEIVDLPSNQDTASQASTVRTAATRTFSRRSEVEDEEFGGPVVGLPHSGDALLEPLLAGDSTSSTVAAVKEDRFKRLGQVVGWGDDLAGQSWLHHSRLAALDVFRGLAILGLLVVNDLGKLWPAVNFSPWDGLLVADLLMPFFLFSVGVSIAFAFRRIPSYSKAVYKILVRALRLFIIGVLLQGGYFHGTEDLSFGASLPHVRYFGVLQRVGIAFLVVALCEVAVTKGNHRYSSKGFFGLVATFMLHWGAAFLLLIFNLGVTYLLPVPDWEFTPRDSSTQLGPLIQFLQPMVSNVTAVKVTCGGMTGDLSPACNAVAYLDRSLLGINHLYQHPAYRRAAECSINSPAVGSLPPDAPGWCQAPFDPEGFASTSIAILTTFAGLHYGHFFTHFKSRSVRATNGLAMAAIFLLLGVSLQAPWNFRFFVLQGIPFNGQLYSVSFMFFTAGMAAGILTLLYLLVDVLKVGFYTRLLEWAGRNPLFVFVLGVCGVFEAVLLGLYWNTPEKNLVSMVNSLFISAFDEPPLAAVAMTVTKVIGWCLAAGFFVHQGHTWTF